MAAARSDARFTARVTDGPEHRWPAIVAVVVAVVIYTLLPSTFIPVPRFILPVVTIADGDPADHPEPAPFHPRDGLVALVGDRARRRAGVLQPGRGRRHPEGAGRAATPTARACCSTPRRSGPPTSSPSGSPTGSSTAADRSHAACPNDPQPRDFRFPQEDLGRPVPWRPAFFDYLYFSLSNMMAFSPTDVMPFTTRAKALMGAAGDHRVMPCSRS